MPLRQALADALTGLGRHDEAEAEYRAALGLSPENGRLKVALATAFSQQGKNGPALVIVEDLLKAADPPPRAVVLHARLLVRADDVERAVRQYKRAVAADPAVADEAFAASLGAACRRGLAADPGHARCGTLLGRTLAATGRAAKAEAVLARVLARHPESASAHQARGWLSIEGGDAAGAESHVRASLRLDPLQAVAPAVLRPARLAGLPVIGGEVRFVRRLDRRTARRTEKPLSMRVAYTAWVLACVVVTMAAILGSPGLLALAAGFAFVAMFIWAEHRRLARRSGSR